MTKDKTVHLTVGNKQAERVKSIMFSLVLVIYNHWNGQWVADEFDYLILFGIFMFFVIETKIIFFKWMILALSATTIIYGYVELLFMLLALLIFYILKSTSIKKYDKNLELMFGHSFVGKFASGRIAVSELDLIFTVVISTLLLVSESRMVDLKWFEEIFKIKLQYGY